MPLQLVPAAVIVLVCGLPLAVTVLALREARGPKGFRWVNEDWVCHCRHGWYDHTEVGLDMPCAALMCSCRHFTKEEPE